MHNPDDYTYFVLLEPFVRRASNSFVLEYNDISTGDFVSISDHKGLPKRYIFDKSKRMIKIHNKNEKLIKAVRNHPQCEGSPNGYYRNGSTSNSNALFKEMNEQRDAELALSAAMKENEATDLCFQIMKDEEKADKLSIYLGFKDSGKIGNVKLLMYAKKEPENFIKAVNSPDFEAKVIVERAISHGILSKVGVNYVCEDFEYGIDIDSAVKNVMNDSDKMSLLKSKFNNK